MTNMKSHFLAGSNGPLRWALMVTACLEAIGIVAGAELGEFTTSRFSGAGNCAFCHDPWGRRSIDTAAPLATDWRATMMAHSFKDPLWRAVMEAEKVENPRLRSFIEDKCQTCHAPLAHDQARADGTNELAFADALKSPLAAEGVGCTLCHQIQSTNLGQHASFSGHYQVGTNRAIFGPYEEVLTMPMQRHVDYTPVHGPQMQDSALCATCHTLFTPVFGPSGEVTGEFPEQVPYLEWRNSDYARNGRQCQDCHMPRVDEPVKISSRPPWLEARAPSWEHQFVGGNTFMLALLAGNARDLQPNADVDQLRVTMHRTRAQLHRAAQLRVSGQREKDGLTLLVELENLTGHKFPTGHPYRRAWLHLTIGNARGRTLFESGAIDKSGAIIGLLNGYGPHRDIITQPDQVQVYQSVMADSAGVVTWSLLRGASYLKDNRIPPKGFTVPGPAAPQIAVLGGAENDANFNAGASGQDQVTFRIALSEPGRVSVHVELLYQSVPPEAVNRLLKADQPAARVFAKRYRRQSSRPEVVQQVDIDL
jgi:hypothetical protein